MVHSMSKNSSEDRKTLIAESILLEDREKLVKTYYHFFYRFLESEEEFKKTHSKESQNKAMYYRIIVKKLIEIENLLITENFKNDWGRTWLLCKLHHDK